MTDPRAARSPRQAGHAARTPAARTPAAPKPAVRKPTAPKPAAPASTRRRGRPSLAPVDDSFSERLLKHWLEDVPDDRLAHLVKDTSRAFLRALQLRLAGHGVALGHWTFLRILWQREGMTQRELSLEAGVMEPTTLHALRAMQALGWVVRTRSAGNRRNLQVRLTPAGRRLKATLVPLAEEVNAVAVRGQSDATLRTVRRSLLAMLDNLARDAARRG